MPTKRVRAAIVGGGIGGLSAANALLIRGIDVTFFEQLAKEATSVVVGADEQRTVDLRLLDAYQPDLVVTDIVMPELEGIGAILQIRRKPRPPKIIATQPPSANTP